MCVGGGGVGGMAVGFKSNKHKEWSMKKKGKRVQKNPQIIGIMCSMAFKHTHTSRQTD